LRYQQLIKFDLTRPPSRSTLRKQRQQVCGLVLKSACKAETDVVSVEPWTGLEKVYKPFCYCSTIGTLFSRKQDTGLHVVCTDSMRGVFNTLVAQHMLFNMKVCIRLLRHKRAPPAHQWDRNMVHGKDDACLALSSQREIELSACLGA
jgi:hypothetical protein